MDLVYSRPLIHTHSHTDSKRAATQVSCPSVKRSWHLVSCPTTYWRGVGAWDRLSGRPTRPPEPQLPKCFDEKKKKKIGVMESQGITKIIWIHPTHSTTVHPFWSSSRSLCFHWGLFVGWFVNRTTQKLLNRVPLNLDGGWVLAQNRSC